MQHALPCASLPIGSSCSLPQVSIAFAGQALIPGDGSFLPFFQAAVPTEDNPSPKWALVFINLLVLWNSVCFCLVSQNCSGSAHSLAYLLSHLHVDLSNH